MKSISLFSGAGGMDVGFKAAGFKVVAASEIDKYACETFRINHPETRLFEGDVNENLTQFDSFSGIDVVFGGPPCQGFSVAGKMDPDDPRSQLIFSFCNVVEKVQPTIFVMENVKALGTLTKFESVRAALISRLQKAGYTVSVHILNAKEYGVPQSRERVFFIGLKSGLGSLPSTFFQKYKKTPPTLREILLILGKPGSKNNERICNAKITLAAKPILRKSPYAGMLFNVQGRPLNPDSWASTLPASMGGNRTPIIDDNHLYHQDNAWIEEYHQHLIRGGKPHGMHEAPSYLRRLTINEAALLQTFPREYVFCGPSSKIFSQIGNAVPCELAKVVALGISEVLTNSSCIKANITEVGQNFELAFA